MSVSFSVDPVPAPWPKPDSYECPYCEPEAPHPRDACKCCEGTGRLKCWDYGPFVTGGWTASTIGTLVEALGLPCEEFPCSWPAADFGRAVDAAGEAARENRAWGAVSTWWLTVRRLGLAEDARVVVA